VTYAATLPQPVSSNFPYYYQNPHLPPALYTIISILTGAPGIGAGIECTAAWKELDNLEEQKAQLFGDDIFESCTQVSPAVQTSTNPSAINYLVIGHGMPHRPFFLLCFQEKHVYIFILSICHINL
jgi:hypothetical protein